MTGGGSCGVENMRSAQGEVLAVGAGSRTNVVADIWDDDGDERVGDVALNAAGAPRVQLAIAEDDVGDALDAVSYQAW